MRRRLPLFRTVLILGALLVTSIVLLLFFGRIDRVVIASGHLTGGCSPVHAPFAGVVAQKLTDNGQQVHAGQAVLVLQTDYLEAEMAQTTTTVASLRDRVNALEEADRRLVVELHPGQEDQALRSVKRAELELARVQARTEALKELRAKGLVSQLEVDEAELAREVAAVEHQSARREVPILRSRQRAELEELELEIRNVRAQIDQENVRLGELSRQLSEARVAAAADGVLVGPRLDEIVGQRVDQGEELFRVVFGEANRFDGVVHDRGRAVTSVGARAKIRLDGYPWLIHGSLTGRVSRIADRPTAGGLFPVTVSFDSESAPGPLFDGMQGTARILIEEKISLGRLLLEKITGRSESP